MENGIPSTSNSTNAIEKNHWLVNSSVQPTESIGKILIIRSYTKEVLSPNWERDWSQLYTKNMSGEEATECVKLIEIKLKNAETNAMNKIYGKRTKTCVKEEKN
jgi:hypothetical protein